MSPAASAVGSAPCEEEAPGSGGSLVGALEVPCRGQGSHWSKARNGRYQGWPLILVRGSLSYSWPCPKCPKSPARKAYIEDLVRNDSSVFDVQNVPTTFFSHTTSTTVFCTLSTGQGPALEGGAIGGISNE